METGNEKEQRPVFSGTEGAREEAPRWETKPMGPPSASTVPEGAGEQATKPVGTPPASAAPDGPEEEAAKWGTRHMGPPSTPWVNSQNQRAALWGPRRGDEDCPYVLERTPVQHTGGGGGPIESILDVFNSWAKKAESLAGNVWASLMTAPSKTDAAWGKLSVAAKAISEGGFEALFRQTFHTNHGEKLKKSFACYLSTTTGPVAGTLYLSNVKIAFCSDLPLSFTAPSGQEAWSYYKVMVPFEKIAAVNPVTLRERPPEKYIQIVTVDAHEFWFMGFVNFEKAVVYVREAVAGDAAARQNPDG